MIDFNKKRIKTIRLNSYRPLCMTSIGMRAISQYGFAPFIDGSCRREPDFENDNPSISSLCRQGIFAPHLFPNDIIVYITVKGNWMENFDHYRLVAILVVIEKKENHSHAASWYKTNNKKTPSNCMFYNNPPYQFHETAGNYNTNLENTKFLNYPIDKQKIIGERRIILWNNEYLKTSNKWGDFIITKPIFIELNNPPILKDNDMIKIFDKVPNTRNPNIITKEQFKKLAKHAGINFINE